MATSVRWRRLSPCLDSSCNESLEAARGCALELQCRCSDSCVRRARAARPPLIPPGRPSIQQPAPR
eukprot:3155427-Alexandrium_andersonii.AAC.1